MRIFLQHVKPLISIRGHDQLCAIVFHATQATRCASSLNSGINQGLRKTERWAKGAGSQLGARAPPARPPSSRTPSVRSPSTGSSSFRTPPPRGNIKSPAKDSSRQRQEKGPVRDDTRHKTDKEQDIKAPSGREHHRRRTMMPISIPYTTAASQFFSGTRIVMSFLLASQRQLYNLYISRDLDSKEVTDLQTQARKRNVTFHMKTRDELAEMERSVIDKNHWSRSTLLECSPPVEPPITSLQHLTSPTDRVLRATLAPQPREDAAINGTSGAVTLTPLPNPRYPLLLWLHGVKNIGNLGAAYRSAAYFGADAVLLSARATAPLNAGVVHTAAGAADAIPTFRVRDPLAFMVASQACGWSFAAAVLDTARPPRPLRPDAPPGNPLLAGPLVVVLGDEQDGLPGAFVACADALITVPGRSEAARGVGLDSLNVSVAGALLIERLLRPGQVLQMDEEEVRQLVTWMAPRQGIARPNDGRDERLANKGTAQGGLLVDHDEETKRSNFWD